MILWLILFLLIVGISFILAFWSMRDYQEIPQQSKAGYSLFLIRRTDSLNSEILDVIRKSMLKQGLIISIERLFKGKKAALAIFGPKKILEQFTKQLDLLELEDYTLNLAGQDIFIWEIGVKGSTNDIFKHLPVLEHEDQFFWQVILSAKEGGDLSFQTQIRAAVYSKDPVRRKTLVPLFQNLSIGQLVKIPRPFSQEQMMSFYKLRSLDKVGHGPVLTSLRVMSLLKIS